MASPDALPLYVQISEMLIRDIAAGRLLEGERLPPERQMASQLGISVGTLRKALDDLTDKALLQRVQGSGNYVRSNPDAGGVYAFFRLERVGGGGGLPTAEVLDVRRMKKPGDAPGFGADPEGHRIRRLRFLSGEPAAVEEIWLDGAYAPALRPADLTASLYHFYATRLGLRIARAEDQVGVGTVPDWAPDGFGLGAGAVCGFIERISYEASGAAAEYSRTWFDPATTRYVARLR